MTLDEATFIELWNEGVDTADMAQRPGIPRSTVASRAHTLVRQGKIAPRPRGNYPRQKALARQDGSPTPATPAALMTPVPPAVPFVAVPEIQEIFSIVTDLQAQVGSLEQTRVPPTLPA